MMILSEVWQRLMLVSMQPMAWIPMATPEEAPARQPSAIRAQRARSRRR